MDVGILNRASNMKFLTTTILLLLSLVLVFVLANWSVIKTSTAVSLVFFEIQAPPALIMLIAMLTAIASLAFYTAFLRSKMYREAYRHRQELEGQRRLAENAEVSRIRELREEIKSEFEQVRTSIDESTNGLAAQIGEIEDKLDRALPSSSGHEA